MTVCTFDSSTVPTYRVVKIDHRGIYHFQCTVVCRTKTYSVYTALAAKAGVTDTPDICAKATRTYAGYTSVQSEHGTKGSLVLNGTTYTNCYIESISAAEVDRSNLGLWEFTISFVRDTSIS